MPLWLIAFGFILMTVCALFALLFLHSFYKKEFFSALIFKGCASLCFVVFGGLNCFLVSRSPVSVIIFIGLCFGIFGDELIALCQIYPERDSLAFISGGSGFLVGHILYIIALLMLGAEGPLSVILSLVMISSVGGIYARRRKFLLGNMKYLLIGYLTVVILFTAISISVFVKQPSPAALLLTIGGALFTVSDNILFAYKLGEQPRFLQNILLHAAYYLAQFSIAWSIGLL